MKHSDCCSEMTGCFIPYCFAVPAFAKSGCSVFKVNYSTVPFLQHVVSQRPNRLMENIYPSLSFLSSNHHLLLLRQGH